MGDKENFVHIKKQDGLILITKEGLRSFPIQKID